MNENKIEVFNSAEFGTVRTLKTENGKVLFCGADVAKALGYSNSRDALLRHCKEKAAFRHYLTLTREMCTGLSRTANCRRQKGWRPDFISYV